MPNTTSYVCAHCGQIYDPGYAHVCHASRLIAEAKAARDKEWNHALSQSNRRAKAIDATNSDWITWAEQECPHVEPFDNSHYYKRECSKCWEERKKEVSK